MKNIYLCKKKKLMLLTCYSIYLIYSMYSRASIQSEFLNRTPVNTFMCYPTSIHGFDANIFHLLYFYSFI